MDFQRNPNQQDLSWFIDMQAQKRLELNPPYQRKSVWTFKDKQFFLDTIFNNYPCPAVYLQKENTPQGPRYNVVDGKQRLSTVLDFYDGRIRLNAKFGISRLRGKKFADLSEEDRSSFYNYIFMVEQIRSDTEVDWGEVFQRVNKNQKKLADQELRHARFDGWFIHRAESEVADEGVEIWKILGISSKARSSRMKDVEFVSMLMLVILEQAFVGFPQYRIDNLYAKYDFELEELPDTEGDIVLNEDEVEAFPGITQQTVKHFETEFERCRSIVQAMEEHNKCITNHKRRITTDLYSIWAALALDANVQELPVQKLAERYGAFIAQIDVAYELNRKGEPIDNLTPDVQLYFGNSTGAATEVDNRSKRHSALVKFLCND